jgi:hypothetical protein
MSHAHDYSFRWSPREHVRASRATTRNTTGALWLRFLPHVTVSVLAIAVLLLFSVVPPERRAISLLNWLPYLFVLVLMNVGVYWWTPWLTARQLQKNDPSVKGGDFRHITTDHGFTIRTAAATVDLTWEHIVQVVETPEFFLYYFRRNCAYATPKRVIPAPDLGDLRSMLRGRLGARARVLEDLNGAA